MRNMLIYAVITLLGGCSATTSSRNIRTAGLVALIDVVAKRSDQSTVTADVVVGGEHSNTYVILEGGDRLFAENGSERHEMNAVSKGTYEAKFAKADGEVVVSLVRDVDTPAPKSSGTMPAPFEITSTFDATARSREKDAITITWSPGQTDAQVTIGLDGDCIHSEEFAVGGDPGTFTIEAGKLTAWKSQKNEACSVAVQVVQAKKGSTDPALDSDSRFTLRQIRESSFVSGP
jgi:hypothetical protein